VVAASRGGGAVPRRIAAPGDPQRLERMPEGPAPHSTVAERVERGRAARAKVPRHTHAALEPAAGRDPIGLLEAEGATRLPELLPIRYGRMLASPLAFYRGAAVVMANDLALLPRTGLRVQLCGDAHLLNFGGFASPERELVFDVNDFDETYPGPFEWDVKRLAASIEIAARDRGFAARDRTPAVLATVRGYRETVQELAGRRDLEVWYAHASAESLADELRVEHEEADVHEVRHLTEQAYASDTLRDLARLTELVDGEPRFTSRPPLIVPLADLVAEAADLEEALRAIFRRYKRTLQADRRHVLGGFRYADLARKVVGIGSVGTRCWALLLLGKDEGDPLFLQLKEAQASVLEPVLGGRSRVSHGQRIVEGQRLSQAVSDIFLGWTSGDGVDGTPRDYYVRQLRDWKVSVDLARIAPRELSLYGRTCGETLARAHGRSGDRVAIAAYLGKNEAFDKALAAFASAYADRNQLDHALRQQSVRDGRLEAA
jgi:uncharacterized protein (DUF2252 family)